MALQGNLETFFLASVFQLLCNDKKTGVLQVGDEGNEVKVYFKEGTVIYAISSQKEHRIGYFLKSKGMLSERDLQKCLQVAKQKKFQLGKVLVDEGYITIDDLKDVISLQVENILYGLFLLQKGNFDYKDAKLNLSGLILTELDAMELILEASRRVDEMSILQKQIPSDKLVFRMSERVQDEEEVKLNSNEWRILSLVNGKRSIREVIMGSGYDDLGAYKILYSLVSSGLIEKAGEVQVEEVPVKKKEVSVDFPGIVTIYNDVFQVILKRLQDELGNRAFSIFDECKKKLVPDQQELFKNFDLKSSVDENVQEVSEAVKVFDDPEEGRAFLIIGFNDLLLGALNKGADILGGQLIHKTREEIEKILSLVDKYQTGSTEKKQIVFGIRDVLQKAG